MIASSNWGLWNLKKYCKEPLENIENYQLALNDTKTVWHCHHKDEIDLKKTHKELKECRLYYDCPAERLIFLHPKDHMKIHGLANLKHIDIELFKEIYYSENNFSVEYICNFFNISNTKKNLFIKENNLKDRDLIIFNKKRLKELFLEKDFTIEQIAEFCNTSKGKIKRLLKLYKLDCYAKYKYKILNNIPVEEKLIKKYKDLDINYIRHLYFDEGVFGYKIAMILNVSKSRIYKIIRELEK